MKTTIAGIVSMALIGLVAVIGWVMNIIKIVGMVGGEITAELVIRGIGVFFFPLGCVMGWVA